MDFAINSIDDNLAVRVLVPVPSHLLPSRLVVLVQTVSDALPKPANYHVGGEKQGKDSKDNADAKAYVCRSRCLASLEDGGMLAGDCGFGLGYPARWRVVDGNGDQGAAMTVGRITVKRKRATRDRKRLS